MVEVVSRKELLRRSSPERVEIGLKLLVMNVLPLLVYVLLVEVVLAWRNERRLQPLVPQIIEWEVPQPGVILDLFSSVGPESVLLLSLNHLRLSQVA